MTWEFFDPAKDTKLACSHCGAMLMDEFFMRLLDEIRRDAGFPFHVTSGYRCPIHNDAVSSTGLSGPHTTGRAVDIAANNSAMRKRIIEVALKHKIPRIGIAKSFIHLDNLLANDGFPEGVWPY